MSTQQSNDARRIDPDLLEASPSTGPEQVSHLSHAVYGLGEPEPRATCKPEDADLKEFLGVSS